MGITTKEYSDKIWECFPISDININALGLCGEAGEFANKLKKQTYKRIQNSELIDELGDVLWHVAQCARLLGTDLDKLMAHSMLKTEERSKEAACQN